MDVLMVNADLASLRFGETQDLRMDATRPGGVWGTGTFTLTYNGQTTTSIPYLVSKGETTGHQTSVGSLAQHRRGQRGSVNASRS